MTSAAAVDVTSARPDGIRAFNAAASPRQRPAQKRDIDAVAAATATLSR